MTNDLELTREIIENVSAAIYVKDAENCFVLVNHAAARLFGKSAHELIGENSNLLPSLEATRSLIEHDLGVMASGKSRQFETHFKVGSESHSFNVSKMPYHDLKGKVSGLISIARDSTERKRGEIALEAQRAFLRQIIDLDPSFIFAKDREGRFTLVNKAIADAYGTTVDDLLGKTDADFDPNKEEVEFFRKKDLEVMDSLQPRFMAEEKITDARGNARWLQTVKIPIIDANGKASQVLGVSTDITLRKRIELLQSAVYQVAQAAEKASSLDNLFKSVHEIIRSVMPAQNFYISLYDSEKDLVSFPYFVDEVDSAPSALKPGKTLTGYVLRTGKSLLCDMSTDLSLQEKGEVEVVGTSSAVWLGVPLIAENRTIGVMTVQHYSNPHAYGEREQQMLEYVSSQVAKAIAHTQAQTALRESEERYRRLVESSPDAIVIHVGGKIVFINEAAVRLGGAQASDELVG